MPFRNINLAELSPADLGFNLFEQDGYFAVPVTRTKWLKIFLDDDNRWVFNCYNGKFLHPNKLIRQTFKVFYTDDFANIFSWLSEEDDNDPTKMMIKAVNEEIKIIQFLDNCSETLTEISDIRIESVNDHDHTFYSVEGRLLNYYYFYYHHNMDEAYLQILSPNSGDTLFESKLYMNVDVGSPSHFLYLYDNCGVFNIFFPFLFESLAQSDYMWVFTPPKKWDEILLSWVMPQQNSVTVAAKTSEEAYEKLAQTLYDGDYAPEYCERILNSEPALLTDEATQADMMRFSEYHEHYRDQQTQKICREETNKMQYQ